MHQVLAGEMIGHERAIEGAGARRGRVGGGPDERVCCGAARSEIRRELHSTKSSPVPRDHAASAETPSATRLARLGRLPWGALTVVLLLAFSAPWAVEPIRDAATLAPTLDATLERPAS